MKHALFAPLFLGLFLPVPPSMAAAPSTNSQQLLAGFQHPSLTHLNRVQTIEIEGGERTEGLYCHFHAVTDLKDGRWRKDESCSVFTTAKGIDAAGDWRKDRWSHICSHYI